MRGPGRRFLVVAASIPLQSSGTSVVIRRLLENFAAEEVVLIGGTPNRDMQLPSRPFQYPVIRIPSLPGGIKGERYWRLVAAIPGVLTGLRAVRRYRPEALLVVFPDESSLLTGYWLHRLTRLPLLAYFSDLYLEDRREGWQGVLARWLQPRVFAAASRIIAGNEGMESFYRSRYDFEPVRLPTCVNVPIPTFSPPPPPRRPLVVGYSGNINATRLSSMRALVRAIGSDPSYEVRYFTPQSRPFLEEQGLWTGNARASFVPDEAQLVVELAACDVLFLPLTFDVDEASFDQLSTCFGTKSYEYFLSQRPVLLHCPGDFFMARFFRQWECGLVVEDPSPKALLAALRRLQGDTALRERLVQNALRAAAHFDGRRIAATLRATLEEVTRNPGERGPRTLLGRAAR